MGTCPKCDKPVTHVIMTGITTNPGTGNQLPAISHECPSCHAVLGVQIDPYVANEEIVKDLKS